VSFAEIRHQDHAVSALERMLAAERVPHAFIFCGPPGVGKALAARALAKVLLCDAPKRPSGKGGAVEACGRCEQCRLVDRGSHPDLNWFRRPPEKSEFILGVVARRDDSPEGLTINESVQLKPMQARGRVTVIEDAELMNAPAANAFLRTFEEAPDGSYLVLLVTTLDRLLPTIRSRGRLVRFRALPDEFVEELLVRDHGLSAEDARIVARFSEGGMDQSSALVRSKFLAIRRELLDALGRLDRAGALVLADAIYAWASEQAREEVQTKAKVEENELRRDYVKRALALVAGLFRDAIVAAASPDADGRLLNADAVPLVKGLAARLPRDRIEYAVRRFIEYQSLVDRNVHVQLLIENACLELADLAAPKRA
jgi:DNA polymerase-3 subunit delta'